MQLIQFTSVTFAIQPKNMKFVCLIVFFSILKIAQAQNVSSYGVEFELSEKYKSKGYMTILGEHNGFKYTSSVKGFAIYGAVMKFEYTISKWAKDDTEPLETIKAKLKGGNFKCSLYNPGQMVLHGSSILQFFVAKDNGKRTESLYVNEYDANKMTIKQTKRIKGVKRKKTKWPVYINLFKDPKNPDKLGMYMEYYTSSKKSKSELFVFDEKLHPIYNKNVGQSESSYYSDFSLSDQWIQYNRKVAGKKGAKDRLYLHLIDINEGSDYKHVCKMVKPNSVPISYGIKRARDGRFLVFGFYSSSSKSSDQAGGFFVQNYSFDGEKKLENEYAHPLDVSFFTEGLSEKKQQKMEKKDAK